MRQVIREMIILTIGAGVLIYLLLPSLMPDIIPLVGWLDEGLATTILLSVLKHYGIDLTSIFGRPSADSIVKASKSENLPGGSQKMQTIRVSRAELERILEERSRYNQIN